MRWARFSSATLLVLPRSSVSFIITTNSKAAFVLRSIDTHSKTVSMTTTSTALPLLSALRNSNRDAEDSEMAMEHVDEQKLKRRTFHHLSVCLVPPSDENNDDDDDVWEQVTKARIECRDPGLFRWPPHCNLLYPFVELRAIRKEEENQRNGPDEDEDNRTTLSSINEDEEESSLSLTPRGDDSIVDADIVQLLHQVCRETTPFRVRLDRLGTFGGARRGVLWLYPYSYDDYDDQSNVGPAKTTDDNDGGGDGNYSRKDDGCPEPLIDLQRRLAAVFPECQKLPSFSPHMTLGHFENLVAAQTIQRGIEEWWKHVDFPVNEIYLLQRLGDGGQFQKVATLRFDGGRERELLGSASSCVLLHYPPMAFPRMPTAEEDWVREARMQLKARRRLGRPQRGRRRSPRGSNNSDGRRRPTKDNEAVIAAKRAARQAKKDYLAAKDRVIAGDASEESLEKYEAKWKQAQLDQSEAEQMQNKAYT